MTSDQIQENNTDCSVVDQFVKKRHFTATISKYTTTFDSSSCRYQVIDCRTPAFCGILDKKGEIILPKLKSIIVKVFKSSFVLCAYFAPGHFTSTYWEDAMNLSLIIRRLARVVLAVITLLLFGCSNDDDTTPTFSGRSAEEISGPITEGGMMVYPQPAVPPPAGYVVEEYFIAGTATSFKSINGTPSDGFWQVAVKDEANYRTRIIVRRPPNDQFSGTVLVEWLNVSAVEASPDWAYLGEEIGRKGHAYIAVSAQAQGVNGGETILDVSVNDQAADDLGDAGSADNSGLVNINSERYGSLIHPGDEYAFDIFSQVGRAAKEDSALLGGLAAKQVIGIGESQSAFFLTTYANAVLPLDPVYDALLIHSRGASAAPLSGLSLAESIDENSESFLEDAVLVRTDLDIPVLIFEAETDLTMLGYANARQPDTERIRTWEVAGTAHADAHQFRSLIGGPRDPSIGVLLGCLDPINTGPHHEVLQAALRHLVDWAAGGPPPPTGSRLELVEGDELVIARDEYQIALGGIRTPLVDVPVAAPTGEPPPSLSSEILGGSFNVCALFGSTHSFDRDTIIALHGTAADYLNAFVASADKAVAAGFLLQADADQLIEEAESNTALFE